MKPTCCITVIATAVNRLISLKTAVRQNGSAHK